MMFVLEGSLFISGISEFSFFAIEHIWKSGNHEKFPEALFRGIKSIYLVSSTFLSILCVHDTTLKVSHKVIKEHLLLKLESEFSCYERRNGT